MKINLNGFFTDKGSVSVKVRNNAKLDMIPLVKKALDSNFESVLIGNDGAYYIAIGEANGKFVYARLELTISVKEPQ